MKFLNFFFFMIFVILSTNIVVDFFEILFFGPVGASKLDACLFSMIFAAIIYALYETTKIVNPNEKYISDIVIANIHADMEKKESCRCSKD